MQIVGFKQTYLLIFLCHKNNFVIGKKIVVETILVAISDSCEVLCFDLYTIMKSTEAERCTEVMFKLTLYC